MKTNLIPADENFRLQDLYAHNILDTEEDKELNELLQVVASICQCPKAAISFIDRERQWLKAKQGMEQTETQRENAFCAHTILSDRLMIVEDATLDTRFCNNPFVTEKNGVRFYAGAPIVSQSGYRLGAVCVLDHQPRNLTPEQAKVLSLISQQISRLLHLRLQHAVLKQRAEECLMLEKQLLQLTLHEQEQERRFISTELHENIAQAIAATKLYLELAEAPLQTGDRWLQKAKETLEELLHQVRELSKSFRPTTLAEFSLQEILETLVARVEAKNPLRVSLFYEGHAAVQPEMAICLYRIVEEQLQQITKQGTAAHAVINVKARHALFLSIKDDSTNFDPTLLKKNAGLNRIMARVERFNGSLDISGDANQGCQLTIRLPMEKQLTAGDYV